MNRTQMLFGIGGLLTALLLVGVLFLAVSASAHNELTVRLIFSISGVLLIIVSAFGFKSLRKLQYG